MRRIAASLLAAATLALAVAPVASAQDQGSALLTLVSQTPWNSPNEASLQIEVSAHNTGDITLDRLQLGWTVWTSVDSRSAYERSLAADPTPAFSIASAVEELQGTLAPGQTRRFSLTIDLSRISSIDLSASKIYPVRLDLRSRGVPTVDGETGGPTVLRTPMVFIVRKPTVPLQVATTFVLDEPIAIGPDGRFTTTTLEQAVAPGGRLRSVLEALQTMLGAKAPFDLAVSPVLLLQLARMRAGYTVAISNTAPRTVATGEGGAAGAAEVLTGLGEVASAPGTELSAMPFAVPTVPSLVEGGLARDLGTQLSRGVDEVGTVLGAAPSEPIFRPPGSALDQPSVDALRASGRSLLLVDPASVPLRPVPPLDFAPPPVASIVAGASSTVSTLVPDAGAQTIMSPDVVTADPALASQATLGELAAIWLEQPSNDRGVSILVPEGELSSGFTPALARRLAGSPFLDPVKATTMATRFPPVDRSASLVPGGTDGFTEAYVAQLKRARRRVGTLRTMFEGSSVLADQLDTNLLIAESGQFIHDETQGRTFIDAANDVADARFSQIEPIVNSRVTLGSRSGTIPVTVSNRTQEPAQVTVELVSPRLRFPQGSERRLTLSGASQTVTFDVQLQTTGQFPVQVLLKAPDGREIGGTTMVLRSTAYSSIALIITVAAAAALLLLWARRFLPSRRSGPSTTSS